MEMNLNKIRKHQIERDIEIKIKPLVHVVVNIWAQTHNKLLNATNEHSTDKLKLDVEKEKYWFFKKRIPLW